jgi:CBS domain-containing protein
MRACDMMTRDPITAHPRDKVDYVARVMRDSDCGSVPVVDQSGRLVGMVTDRDVVVRLIAERVDPREAIISDCMTSGAVSCHFYDPIYECIGQMARHQVRRLPVVDDDGRVVGVISQCDLARHAGVYPGQGERRALADVLCAISEPGSFSRR